MCVFVHFMYSCMSALHRLRFGVESARVSVSVCGCAPRTLKGTGQSESTMNPGSPPWLRSERSPAGGGVGSGSDAYTGEGRQRWKS